MAFRPRPTPEVVAETPEKLFPLLPRTNENSDGLWSQQTDILRDYMKHAETRDLAVELPTGTGKTLPGLLIADWRRRAKRGRSVFACPTVQLVRQVVRAANREGVPVVDLSGGWKSWDQQDVRRYEGAQAIAVVTYSTIFNSNPRLGAPETLVFDDAHAADQYVSSSYTVVIKRTDLESVYEELLEALRPGMSQERHAQLAMRSPGATARANVDLMFPALLENTEALDHALIRLEQLQGHAATEQAFRYRTIRGHLSACNVYVSANRIEIRPTVAPTFENAVFSGPTQRVYLSATLGAAGELERAFSRPKITRLTLPAAAAKPRSGRRFVVFPHLVPDVDPDALTRRLLSLSDRAIVLTPSDWAAGQATETIVPEGWSVLTRQDVVDSFDTFAKSSDTVCVLANRYDGIDLPGNACRVVALYGLPRATTLHEEFLSGRARASAALEERLRARVVQGTGRCTRGPRDYALVVIADPETTRYLSRTEVQSSLDEDLQAEVQFGLEQSEAGEAQLLENVRVFLERDPAWQTDAEPIIAEFRSATTSVTPAGAAGLLAAAPKEVAAAEASWAGDWKGAGERHHSAAEALSSYPTTRGYRGYEMFLGAVSFSTDGRQNGDDTSVRTADELALQAVKIASPAMWMRTSMPFPGATDRPLTTADELAINAVNDALGHATSPAKHNASIARMLEGLAAVDHQQYEPALSALGTLLGADAAKPQGDGRADSVWCWGDALWITLEAKSEHVSEGPIGLDDVRQVNHHLEFVSSDRSAPVPTGSASVMITPRRVFKRDSITIAEDYTFRISPDSILTLAAAAEQLWLLLRTLRTTSDPAMRRSSVEATLADARLLPSDLLDRLTAEPIKPI